MLTSSLKSPITMSRSVANSRKGSAFVHSRRAPFILWPVGMTSPRPLQWKAVALQIRPKVRAERIVCRATRALGQMQFLAANKCQGHVSSRDHSSGHRETHEQGQRPDGRALAAARQASETGLIPGRGVEDVPPVGRM